MADAQFGPTDYCGGIASVVVKVGGSPFAPEGNQFQQRLSLDTAECAVDGQGVNVRCFVSSVADVLVMEIDDQRDEPQPLKVNLVMLREPEVRTGEHVATTAFVDNADRVLLTQRFTEAGLLQRFGCRRVARRGWRAHRCSLGERKIDGGPASPRQADRLDFQRRNVGREPSMSARRRLVS